MGLFRDPGEQEIDIVKEMAEALGSTGLRLEELLEQAQTAGERARAMLAKFHESGNGCEAPAITLVNESIREYNVLVDKAENALRWLLIQREACGFRTHRHVDIFYPIPPKIKPLKP